MLEQMQGSPRLGDGGAGACETAEGLLPGARSAKVWGWLEGAGPLPNVLLRGAGAALGRGRDPGPDLEALRLGARTSSPRPRQRLQRTLSFAEIPDGRVSRLHCIVRAGGPGSAVPSSAALLEDFSTNGTFLNGERVPAGAAVALRDGDRLSLVLSVAPLTEQFFTFHQGDLRLESEGARQRASQERAASPAPGAPGGGPGPRWQPSPKGLQRTSTSRYTTEATATPADLQCQICLGTLRACVALEPCGHCYCAVCLSHHFAALLEGGQPVSCPLRCSPPERVVANPTVRALVTRVQHLSESGEPAEEEEEEELLEMSPMCILSDDMLPLDAASIKRKQVEGALAALRAASQGPFEVLEALEAVARLSWSDDEVRLLVADVGGVESVVRAMRAHQHQEHVQCAGCLALMSLVRGEGEVSQANQWKVVRARGVEAIVAAMRALREHAMVQLSALLAFIPLALENAMLQAHVACLALEEVLHAMAVHRSVANVQAKGLIVLGVLGQGEEEVHEAIRARQLALGAPAAVARALAQHCRPDVSGAGSRNPADDPDHGGNPGGGDGEDDGGASEEVLWGGLFALASLLREGAGARSPAARAAAAAGLPALLRRCLAAYQAAAASRDGDADDMIVQAGLYLSASLGAAERALSLQRLSTAALAATLALLLWRLLRTMRSNRIG
ncbi:hypothetical protein WJX81_002548 [Elliptochloris bilobata]|uniref:E3 ubiquitin-protein ligase CHFR n=1 Tax=Elliptochloris bilobata TaxID=381761 RepID=A0AAW1SIF1_9CHLO